MSTPAFIRALAPKSRPARRRRAIADDFNRLYYGQRSQTWMNTRWLGVDAFKLPTDLWVYQEIITETRPDLIVETGTMFGGSALYLASVCDLLDHGRVVTVDIEDHGPYRAHERIEYRTHSSIDADWIAELGECCAGLDSVLVILDSDHSRDHVLAELEVYAPLVRAGGYLIVEDTNVNGHPVYESHGPGPMEAVDEWLPTRDDFEVDRDREKLMLTSNPSGYLRRVR